MTPWTMSSVPLDTGALYYVCEWLIRLGALIVVPLRRSPEATRSWLLLIFFLPVVGLIFYLAIGRPRFPAWRAARFKDMTPIISDLATRLSPEEPANMAAVIAGKLGHMPAVSGNTIELLGDYDGMIGRLVADIDDARDHVRILVYIFANDDTGKKVVAALTRAVHRGVVVHVLLDPVGSRPWLKGTIKALKAGGVQVRQALPFHWLRDRTRRDMRNHRKLFLIDGRIGYAGSQNIVDKDFRPGVVNQELVTRVTGPAVAEMTAVFISDWYLETEILLEETIIIPPDEGQSRLQLLPSGANYPLEGFQTLLVWQLHRARRRVVITSPYFIPDEGLLDAMRTAILRDVAIDLIVSAVVDQKLVSLAQRSFYDELLRSGVNIHLFQRFLLHAKNVSIDEDLAIIGSSNVDLRSFQLNEEVSLLFLDSGDVRAITTVQNDYIANSEQLILETWRERGGFVKFQENMARLVSSLL